MCKNYEKQHFHVIIFHLANIVILLIINKILKSITYYFYFMYPINKKKKAYEFIQLLDRMKLNIYVLI